MTEPVEAPAVAVRWRGEWTASELYPAGDVVTWGGASWVANEKPPKGDSGKPGLHAAWVKLGTETGGSADCGQVRGCVTAPGDLLTFDGSGNLTVKIARCYERDIAVELECVEYKSAPAAWGETWYPRARIVDPDDGMPVVQVRAKGDTAWNYVPRGGGWSGLGAAGLLHLPCPDEALVELRYEDGLAQEVRIPLQDCSGAPVSFVLTGCGANPLVIVEEDGVGKLAVKPTPGPAGPEGPKGDKGDPGSFASVTTDGVITHSVDSEGNLTLGVDCAALASKCDPCYGRLTAEHVGEGQAPLVTLTVPSGHADQVEFADFVFGKPAAACKATVEYHQQKAILLKVPTVRFHAGASDAEYFFLRVKSGEVLDTKDSVTARPGSWSPYLRLKDRGGPWEIELVEHFAIDNNPVIATFTLQQTEDPQTLAFPEGCGSSRRRIFTLHPGETERVADLDPWPDDQIEIVAHHPGDRLEHCGPFTGDRIGAPGEGEVLVLACPDGCEKGGGTGGGLACEQVAGCVSDDPNNSLTVDGAGKLFVRDAEQYCYALWRRSRSQSQIDVQAALHNTGPVSVIVDGLSPRPIQPGGREPVPFPPNVQRIVIDATAAGGPSCVITPDQLQPGATGACCRATSATRWKGPHDAGKDYVAGELVESGGSTYIASQDVAAGVDPPDAPWELVAARGDQGPEGPPGPKGDSAGGGEVKLRATTIGMPLGANDVPFDEVTPSDGFEIVDGQVVFGRAGVWQFAGLTSFNLGSPVADNKPHYPFLKWFLTGGDAPSDYIAGNFPVFRLGDPVRRVLYPTVTFYAAVGQQLSLKGGNQSVANHAPNRFTVDGAFAVSLLREVTLPASPSAAV